MNLGYIIDAVFISIEFLIFARIILSFLPMVMRIDPYHPIIRFINEITEPLMAPFRRLLPPLGGMDFSPLLLFMVLNLLQGIVKDIVRGF